MTSPRLGLAVLAALVLAAGATRAQSADAVASTRQLSVGEQMTYTLTIRGGLGSGIQAPLATGGLRLLSRQPTLDITTSFNGETERRLAWSYEGVRPGAGRIGRITVRVGGQSIPIDPVLVTVQPGASVAAPGAQAPPSGSSELFARAEVGRQTAYVGQQVVVDYVLYFEPSVQPRQTAPVGTWDAAGFWREEMDVPATYPRSVTLGGQPYEAVTIRRIALFPTRSGELTLAPMQFSVDLLRTMRSFGNDPFGPFFSPFSSRYEEEEVTAPAATITVRDLPDGAPADFSGAVGQFELSSQINQRRVNAGEAVELLLSLSGTGNVATVEAPEIQAPPGFDAYDPKEDRQLARGAEPLRGVKTFTYTLVPQGGGTFEVPPVTWSYFDPTDGQYKTLRSDPVEIVVDGPALDAAAPVAVGPDAPAALLTEADWQRPPGSVGWLWALLGGGLALPALAAGLFLAARVGRQRLDADTPERRRRRAGADVRRRLDAARGLTGSAAYAEVERATHAFLADRFGIPAATLPRADLDRALADMPDDLRTRTLVLLDVCQRGQYAPGLPGGLSPDATVAEAEATLDALDRVGKEQQRPARRRREPAAIPA